MFGGHEGGFGSLEKPNSIPTECPGTSKIICPACTDAGLGVNGNELWRIIRLRINCEGHDEHCDFFNPDAQASTIVLKYILVGFLGSGASDSLLPGIRAGAIALDEMLDLHLGLIRKEKEKNKTNKEEKELQ